MIDNSQIYQWWEVFRSGNLLTEIRLIQGKRNWSGYFTSPDDIINAITPFDNVDGLQMYYTINEVDRACYSREQGDKLVQGASNTDDNAISKRIWIFVDLDPEHGKIKGISSTLEELNASYLRACKVYMFLKDQGFYDPVVCMSGNGYHLQYRCDMPNTKQNDELVSRFLKALGMMFSDEVISIDSTVSNAARICKLYGTTAKKGRSTAERPWRQAKIVQVPAVIEATDKAYFEKVANFFPVPEKIPTAQSGYTRERFDVVEFMNKHGIAYKEEHTSIGTKYILDHCIFDESHKGKDAMIFQGLDGALGYHCFHNHCQHYTWKDVRLKFEPDAYDRNVRQTYLREKQPWQQQYVAPQPLQQTQDKGPVWLTMSQIVKPKFSILNYIPSGVSQIEKLILGFKRGHVSVWSGYRGCGKSSLLNMLILNAAQMKYKSALWTGELGGAEIKDWLCLQAAGKARNVNVRNDFYETPPEIIAKIDIWISELLWVFNEKYGKNFEQILDSVRKLKAEHDIDQVIFDNLMVLDYDSLDNNVYVGQKKVMQALHDLAIELNIHIHIVAHPNKSGNFLRMNSISGTANITDLAQNVFILHRIGRDFESSAKEFLTKKVIKSILESDCTNVIEICKCRDKGTAIDHFIKLFYEKESNRLKDSKAENIIYNWADIDEETALVSAYDAQHSQETKPKETAENQDSYVDYSEPRQKDLPFDEAHTDDMPF